MVVVRRAGVDDWASWRPLRLRSLTEDRAAFKASVLPWTGPQDTEVRWRARMDEDVLFLASLDGDDVGMVGARTAGCEVELISMWVAPTGRGVGVGRALVDAVVREADGRPVRLQVIDGNEPALRLYGSCGFALVDDGPDAEHCRLMRRA